MDNGTTYGGSALTDYAKQQAQGGIREAFSPSVSYEVNPLGKCECHDCTQARWKMSVQGQIQNACGKAHSLQGLQQQKG